LIPISNKKKMNQDLPGLVTGNKSIAFAFTGKDNPYLIPDNPNFSSRPVQAKKNAVAFGNSIISFRNAG